MNPLKQVTLMLVVNQISKMLIQILHSMLLALITLQTPPIIQTILIHSQAPQPPRREPPKPPVPLADNPPSIPILVLVLIVIVMVFTTVRRK